MDKKIPTADLGKHEQEAGSAFDNAAQPTVASDDILLAGSSKVASNSSIGERTGKPTEGLIRLRQVRFELSPKTIMLLVLVAVSAWLLIRLWPVFLVLVAALVIAGTLSPAVTWLETRHVKRGLGIAIVFLSFFIFALLVVFLTIPTLAEQVMSILERESLLRAQLADYFAGSDLTTPLATWLRGLRPDALRSALSDTAFAFTMRFVVAFAYGLSAIFLGLYIMIDRDRLRGGLFALFPRAHHLRLSRIMMNLETIVGAYIRGQLVTSLLMAAFTFGLLKACGVENALALAVFAGLADVLPYVGPFLSVTPAVVAALPLGPVVPVVVLVSMVVYEEFESRVLIPRIYGRALRLPSSVVLFSLLVGGTLMGIIGALLALPVAATIMMIIEELRVDLPGEEKLNPDALRRDADDRGEEEYQRRSTGVRAEQAAAIAVEISHDRREEEKCLQVEVGIVIEDAGTKEQ